MTNKNSSPEKTRISAVLLALLVTLLWASSFILIKFGLQDSIPPITFAGLRYSFAFLCLLLLVLINPAQRRTFRSISPTNWIQLTLLGVFFYTINQGAHFIGLSLLPANTTSLIYSFGPLFIAMASGFLIKEAPSTIQWIGIVVSISGALLYFLPSNSSMGQQLGYLIALVSVLANSISSLLGRHINHKSGLTPLMVTTISMGIGATLLLIIGGITQGFGQLEFSHWLIIGWLAVVNTALAFTLWNTALRTLSAFEAGIINNTMLIQVGILAWLFLDEPLGTRQIFAMLLVMIGMIIVQLKGRPPKDTQAG
jgi:drug/metabolite transporter (DMT)-like permease